MNDMTIDADTLNSKWFIDKDWFEQNGRSLPVLVQGCLCAKCYQKLKPQSQVVTTDRLMKSVKDCCSKTPDFIRTGMPVMESVFRLFLATGNKPIAQEDILRQLGERCGVGLYHLSSIVLITLLKNDRYYGLSRIAD